MSQAVQETLPQISEGTGTIGKYRWWICGLLFLAATINYVDRSVLSILKTPLSKEFSWSESDYATIVLWFQAAYAGGYLFAGRLMDLIGLRLGYSLSVAVWSLFAAARAFVRTIPGFSVTQFGLGLAEGGNFPASVKTVAEWFPKKERALATGLFNSGSCIGPIVAPLIVPWLALRYGWQAAFLVTGLVGLLWLVGWIYAYRPPDRHPRLGASELNYIQSDAPEIQKKVAWTELLQHRATWAAMIGMLLTWPVWWFYIFWIPGYIFDQYHLDLKTIGPPVIIVFLMSDIGSISGGWLSSKLVRRGWNPVSSRKLTMLICALCVVPVFFASQLTSLWAAVLVIGLAMAGHQGWSANLYTFVSDTQQRTAVSTVVGMGGACGSVLGMFMAKLVGYILDTTHSYHLIFAIAPAAYLMALLMIHLLVPRFAGKAETS